MKVEDVLSMSSLEFAEWQRYYPMEAFGPMVQEIQLARLSYLIAQAWFADKKKGIQFDPREFLITPELAHVRSKQTWAEQLELVKMLAKATNTTLTEGAES